MPRLAAFLLLAGVAVSALPRRRAVPVSPVHAEPTGLRLLTIDELRLFHARSPSKAVH